jgi:hypothetical protein
LIDALILITALKFRPAQIKTPPSQYVLCTAKYGRFPPAERNRTRRIKFETIRTLALVAFTVEEIVTEGPQETFYTNSFRSSMLVNEDQYAPSVVG